MYKQSNNSGVIILPHSKMMPPDEAQHKVHELAKVQEQILTTSKLLPDKIKEPGQTTIILRRMACISHWKNLPNHKKV